MMKNKLYEDVMGWAEGSKERLEDVAQYGCVSGTVGHLVYYADTHKYFDTYYNEIMEEVEEYEDMTGEKVCPKGDIKNWYSWFAFESAAYNLLNQLEDDE